MKVYHLTLGFGLLFLILGLFLVNYSVKIVIQCGPGFYCPSSPYISFPYAGAGLSLLALGGSLGLASFVLRPLQPSTPPRRTSSR